MHPNYLKITTVLHALTKVLLVLCIDKDILIILPSSCTQAIFFLFLACKLSQPSQWHPAVCRKSSNCHCCVAVLPWRYVQASIVGSHYLFLHVVIIWFMVMLADEVDHVVVAHLGSYEFLNNRSHFKMKYGRGHL
jgi:hypothetical protein